VGEGEVFARRILHVRIRGRRRRIELRVFRPARVDAREYRCRCAIVGDGKVRWFSLAGADEVQALLLALGFLGLEVDRLRLSHWHVDGKPVADLLRILPDRGPH